MKIRAKGGNCYNMKMFNKKKLFPINKATNSLSIQTSVKYWLYVWLTI
jgi:hypothetical protein